MKPKALHTVRSFRMEDLDAVMELWLAGNLDAHAFIPPAYWEGQLAAVRGMIPEAELLVCETAGEVRGFLGLDGGYIAGIFVHAASRSQGIGKLLLDAAKARRTSLTLHVYAQNTGAAAFYRREGFSVSGEGADPQTGAAELEMCWTRS